MFSNRKKKEKKPNAVFSKEIGFSAATALFTMVESKGKNQFFDFTIVNRAVAALIGYNSIFLLNIFSSIWLFSFFFQSIAVIVFLVFLDSVLDKMLNIRSKRTILNDQNACL